MDDDPKAEMMRAVAEDNLHSLPLFHYSDRWWSYNDPVGHHLHPHDQKGEVKWNHQDFKWILEWNPVVRANGKFILPFLKHQEPHQDSLNRWSSLSILHLRIYNSAQRKDIPLTFAMGHEGSLEERGKRMITRENDQMDGERKQCYACC